MDDVVHGSTVDKARTMDTGEVHGYDVGAHGGTTRPMPGSVEEGEDAHHSNPARRITRLLARSSARATR